jgi:hypothetical protein
MPDPLWEEAFRTANPAWRGADANYSVALPENRTLWLFGDTWITAPEAETRSGARMIRNSLAIQPIVKGRKAQPARPEYFWRTAADGGADDAFKPKTGPGWLWPLSGFHAGDRLVLFFSQLIKTDEGLGFESHANLYMIIDNPEDPPLAWRPRQVSIPFFSHSKFGDRVFGLANHGEGESVHIYGVRENWLKGMGGRSLIVAETTLEALSREDFSQWRFWTGSGWDADIDKAAALFDGAASEMSVSPLPGSGGLVATYTEAGWSPKILARFAPRPEGPWGPPVTLYVAPDAGWKKDYFCYAAKAHPQLVASGDELLITYATNSMKLADHVHDPRIYWPRFVRVKFQKFPGTS